MSGSRASAAVPPTSNSPADSLVGAPAIAPSDLRSRVARLLLLRTVVVTVVLGLSLWLLATGERPARLALWLQSAVIAATYVSSIVIGVLLRRGFDAKRVARPMHASDLALTSLIEPFMMVFLGIVIGGLILAMYLPIFKLAGNIKS